MKDMKRGKESTFENMSANEREIYDKFKSYR
jgi:hypothetical protein